MIGIFLSCLKMSALLIDRYTLEQAFFNVREGHIPLDTEEYTASLLISYLNILIFVPIIANILMADYNTAKGFIFIRMKNLFNWYKTKLIQSAVYCLVSVFIYNLIILIMLIAMGFRAESGVDTFIYLVLSVLASFLILFFSVSLVQICSFRMPTHFASIIILSALCIVLYSIQFLPKSFIEYNLLSHYFVSWFTLFPNYEEVHSYPIWGYYSAILILIFIEILTGKKILQKSDML